MKKILLTFTLILSLILITGCSMDNTPTKKTERFLNNYRNLDETVTTQMNEVISQDALLSDNQRTIYKDVIRKQYQDLTYTIKDETIDGNDATVNVEIEVYDLYKANKDSEVYYTTNNDEFLDEHGNLSDTKVIDYRINSLKDTRERVKYNIDFKLKKVDNVWIMQDIDEITRQKIHGLFAY